MKQVQHILFGMFLIVLPLTGCDANSNEIPNPTPVEGIISVLPQTGLKNAQPTPSTKAVNDARLTYTFEVWTSGSDSRCVLHRTASGTLSGGTSFEISLVPGTYNLLFWADYGTENYTTLNLHAVKRKTTPYTAGENQDAFACALRNHEWNGGGLSATLTRPLTKLTIQNTKPFSQALPVSVTYDNLYTSYNVLTGEAFDPQPSTVTTFQTTSGSTFIGEDFLFVPSAGEEQISLSITANNTTQSLGTLPLQTNYKTNITASFD